MFRQTEEGRARMLASDREKLAALEPGGTAERPIDVVSSPVIDIRAKAMPCLRCQGEVNLEEQTAEMVDGKSLRLAHLTCVRCGSKRKVWFRITSPLPN